MTLKYMMTTTFGMFSLAAGITAVHADDFYAPATQTVAYGDLNLDSNAGAKVFHGRVKNAARDVCAPLADRDLGRAARYRTCYDNAINAAVAEVNKTKVNALLHPDAKVDAAPALARLR